MDVARRILIVDFSRWESFRLRNEFYNKSSLDIVTIMSNAGAGLNELAQANYDIAVFDLATILAYEINGRKFIRDFAKITEESRLVIVDGISDPELNTSILSKLSFYLDSGRVSIINKEHQSYLIIPALVDKLVPEPALVSTDKPDMVTGLGIDEITHPTSLKGRLSHEVNNPLMTILGTVELLLDKQEYSEGEIGRKLRMIQRSARRIRASIEKMNEDMGQPDNRRLPRNRLSTNRVLSKI